jgi:hypothetical protein
MQTIDDVLEYLARCADRADAGDLPTGYGIFARAYHRFTLALSSYEASGVFEDPAWIADFDVRFARRYELAVEHPDQRAKPWAIAMREAEEAPQRTFRHLMLGIIAHMRYDLCAVLLEGIIDDRDRRHRDFLEVNAILARAVDGVQRSIEARYGGVLAIADFALAHVDEVLTEKEFIAWRGEAWTNAMAILDGTKSLADVEREVAKASRVWSLVPV